MPKKFCSPLEGVVETDWSPYTFTMNWQILEPFEPVTFEKGEPICQIVPVKRGALEEVEPEFQELTGEEKELYGAWADRRQEFITALANGEPEATKQGWQREYFQGNAHGQRVSEHQTKSHLRPFEEG